MYTVADGSPAAAAAPDGAPLIQPYDELLSVCGVEVTSALQAVTLIREAAAGELPIRKIAAPPQLASATLALQTGLRERMAARQVCVT